MVSYSDVSNTVCFDAYTHPDYPVELLIYNYNNKTISLLLNSSNSSNCTNLMLETSERCEMIELSVLAGNMLGNSTSTTHINHGI